MTVKACMFRLFAFPTILLVASQTLSAQQPGDGANKKSRKATSVKAAVKTKTAKSGKNSNRKFDGPGAPTEEQETAAINFAGKHHPELVTLLERLKHENKSQYNRAIRELASTNERLAKMTRYPERQVQELNKWKLDSRIRLILARLKMADPSEVDRLQSQLHALVEQRTDNQLARLLEEKMKLDLRLEKTNAAIGDIEADRSAYIDRELKRLQRTLPKSKSTKSKPSPKPTKQSIADRRKAKAAQAQSKDSDAAASERIQKTKQNNSQTKK